MNPSQIPQLIAEIALADPRVRRTDPTEQRGQIHMWAGILTDVPYDFAIRAAHRHYAESQWPILPANIATQWKATVRDRLERHTDPTPQADPDDPHQWNEELRAQRRAVIAGELDPAPYTAAEGTPRPIAALTAAVGQPPRYIPDDVRAQLDAAMPRRAQREAERAARQAAGEPDPLTIACPWCSAREGVMCRHMGRKTRLTPRTTFHPARIAAVAEQQRQASA